GDRIIDLKVLDTDGRVLTSYVQPVSVADEDFFYVGIADVTLSKGSTDGSIAALTPEDRERFGGDVMVDGRLAFYLRGKVRGDWLMTAAADTGEGPVEDLFNNFLDRDARSYLRRLDPEEYYPVYGDDSTAVNDAPTDGKFYVQLKREGAELLWGNFRTTQPGTHLTNFTRSLYGARAQYSTGVMENGEPRVRAELFAADPGTVQAQEEFRGTGGSLYYLRNRDILQGSQEIWVEVRDRNTGVLLSRRQLAPLEDYSINVIQGRLQLNTPLSSTAASGTLVGGATTGGDPQYLVVRYEYSPTLTAPDTKVLGGSADYWVSEQLRVGVNALRQQDGGDEQTLGGVNATYLLSDRSSIELEAARSRDVGVTVYQSLDGGFNFTARPGGTGEEAGAGRVALSLDLADAGLGEGRLALQWQRREAGFSGPGVQTDEDVTQMGLDLTTQLTARTDLRFVLEETDKQSQTERSGEVDIGYQVNDALKLGFGLLVDDVTTRTANASNTLSTNGRRLDGVLRADYAPGDDWSVYGYVQGTLDKDGSRADNNRVGVGGNVALGERLTFGGEVSSGTGGFGARISAGLQVDDRTRTYLSYEMSPDSEDNTERGQIGQFTYGGTRQVNDHVYVLAEQTYHHGDGPVGFVNSFGLDYSPIDSWVFGFRGEAGDLADPVTGDLKRRAVSLSATYSLEKVRYSGILEYRLDDGDERRKTWAMRNSLAYQVSDDWRFLGRLGVSMSDTDAAGVEDTEFVEFVSGFAYRPVENDKLNALFRYTYLYDTASPGQVGSDGASVEFAQRSHVLSVDAIYELNNTLSLGGKFGMRLGEVRPTGGDWIGSNAYLGIIRADVRLRPKWDVLGEYRVLDTPAAGSSQDGVLVAVYRRLNENFRIGIGYNATDFSSDLTDQSYSAKGPFLNIIGKF
ncbi:MAG: hypothetical protein WBN04_06945, partial [Paracoccaceae bacterium]